MSDGYDWVPFYEEMAKTLLDYRGRQPELVAILKESGVHVSNDEHPPRHSFQLSEIDPFTFMALLNKHSVAERTRILGAIRLRLSITIQAPTAFLGVPKAHGLKTWLFPFRYERKENDIGTLWDLFEVVVSGRELDDGLFAAALAIKCVGTAKLTQAIFWAAPKRFFPIDGQTRPYLRKHGLPNEISSATDYQALCARLQACVRSPFYEQSFEAWRLNQNQEPDAEASYQRKVMEAAVQGKAVEEPPGGLPVPRRKKSASPTGAGYERNPLAASKAIQDANFQCELDVGHQTFLSNAKGNFYVEAHHLIPFANQRSFGVSLDVAANIVALCPNCHRLLHHGRRADKAKEILTLFHRRKDRLLEKRLGISAAELMAFYGKDLLEEAS